MTREVVTVTPETTLRNAARLMTKHRVSALPVVNAGVVVGLISEADLVMPDAGDAGQRRNLLLHSLAEGIEIAPEYLAALQSGSRTVGQAMQGGLVWVPEQTPLREVAKMMAESGVRRVLVLRDGALAGIVSRRDLVRTFAQGGAR